MATTNLGRLEPVNLRRVWANEESDFTPWLADQKNLAILGDALGMSLEFVSREEAVGPYSADILCRDSNDGTQVVVENQLESTDHDHLGKLLTYAAHLGARVLVWIAKSFTDQHRAALDWLNEVSETGTRFFGLEIELWQIGESPPAPKFNVVARPNDWTKEGTDVATLTDTQRMQLRLLGGLRGIRVPKRQDSHQDQHRTKASELAGDGRSRTRRASSYMVVDVHMDGGWWSRTQGGVRQSPGSTATTILICSTPTDTMSRTSTSSTRSWNGTIPPTSSSEKSIGALRPTSGIPTLLTEQYRWLLERGEALHRILAPRVGKLPWPG